MSGSPSARRPHPLSRIVIICRITGLPIYDKCWKWSLSVQEGDESGEIMLERLAGCVKTFHALASDVDVRDGKVHKIRFQDERQEDLLSNHINMAKHSGTYHHRPLKAVPKKPTIPPLTCIPFANDQVIVASFYSEDIIQKSRSRTSTNRNNNSSTAITTNNNSNDNNKDNNDSNNNNNNNSNNKKPLDAESSLSLTSTYETKEQKEKEVKQFTESLLTEFGKRYTEKMTDMLPLIKRVAGDKINGIKPEKNVMEEFSDFSAVVDDYSSAYTKN